jgi:hypothetical protein
MADWHGYFAIINLGLNTSQRQTLNSGLSALGPGTSTRPAHLNHRRVRLDNDGIIYESLFDDATLTIAAIKQRLATLFNVAVETISHTLTTQSYAGGTSQVVVFRHSNVDRIQMIAFGGVGSTRAQSLTEVLGYLAANRAAWEL